MKRLLFLFMALLAFTTSSLEAQSTYSEEGETMLVYSDLLGEEVEITFGVTPISEIPQEISMSMCTPCHNNYLLCCVYDDDRDSGDHLNSENNVSPEDIEYGVTLKSELSPHDAAVYCKPGCGGYCCPPDDDRDGDY